jgi:hypothetical protein
MIIFSKEHLESLNKGDRFKTRGLLAGVDPKEELTWEFIHRGKAGNSFYFDLTSFGDVMVTSVVATVTPRGVSVEEIE